MTKKTKKKLSIWMAGFVCTATAIHFLFTQNYAACLWVLFAVYAMVNLFVLDMHMAELQKWMYKSANINKRVTKRLVIEQGKNEALLANCKRYQDELKRLRTYDNSTNRCSNN